jgi:hypothetical protein
MRHRIRSRNRAHRRQRARVNTFDANTFLDGMNATLAAERARQARCLQIERLHSTWSPTITNCLNTLGKRIWGLGNYEIADDVDPDAYWREYQVKGLEWHERTDRFQVRNQDDWYDYTYRLGYRLRLEVKGDQYVLANAPLTEDSLMQWFLGVCEEGCPQCMEEHVTRLY